MYLGRRFIGDALHSIGHMNASAYLCKQGWRGQGFPLDYSGCGLANPLLIYHKTNRTGLGNKKNDYSEQWWLNSLDKKLKDFGEKKRVSLLRRR